MNDLQIFIYGGDQLRTIQRSDGLWWVLRDVCQVLGMSNPAMVAQRLDEDEKGVSQIYTPGGTQNLTIINEPGLYAVILRSDKPEAKQFKRWVTHEVLPSIRKTGAYGIPPERLAHINDIQQRLDEWRELTEDLERCTADACQKARKIRGQYDQLRAQRDKCRSYVRLYEDMLAEEIRAIGGKEKDR